VPAAPQGHGATRGQKDGLPVVQTLTSCWAYSEVHCTTFARRVDAPSITQRTTSVACSSTFWSPAKIYHDPGRGWPTK